MMYPDLAPKLKIRETISNPEEPAEVIGFLGRNAILGKEALVMKQKAVRTDRGEKMVSMPQEIAGNLKEDMDLVVLDGDEVYVATGAAFWKQAETATSVGDLGNTTQVVEAPLAAQPFRLFPRNKVEVGN